MSSLRSQFFCGRCVVSKNVDRVRSTSPSAATGVDIRERGGRDSRVLTRHTRTPAARFLSTSSTQTDGETRHCMTHTHSERERRTQTQTHNSLGKRMPVRLPFCPDGPAGTGQGTWKFPVFFLVFFFLVSSRVCFVCVLNWSWPPSHPFQVRLVVLCSVTQVVCPPPLGDSPRD